MGVRRYSSRATPLGRVLTSELAGAIAYDRIAGYFSSSILEVAGESLEAMSDGAVARIVCNSTLSPLDVATAKAAKARTYQLWCASLPAELSPAMRTRLGRLYQFLSSGRLQVRVLPNERFGLLHGKAGVVTRPGGSRLCFIGSTNETQAAFELNYELVWTDDSADGVVWTQSEFDALWGHPDAVDLSEAVVADVARLAKRSVIPSPADWRDERAEPAAPIVELPVYRRDNGLWAHQKSFVARAFAAHRNGGARFVLADQVGLGKTVQLALAAKLMALWGSDPVLILAPKTLLTQWQDELWTLLAMPSAVWTGRAWVDENDVEHPARGVESLAQCPRRVGIVSSGLVTQSVQSATVLLGRRYECVILDEAHRARRRNLGATHRDEAPDPNNLLRFVRDISSRTTSMLLATATPVQLDPIEAWDLLEALSQGSPSVLGSQYGPWRREARLGLDLIAGHQAAPDDPHETWEWIRDPLPPGAEDPEFDALRRSLNIPDERSWAAAGIDGWTPAQLGRLRRLGGDFFQVHNPYIRHIVRRSRAYLESTIDPHTGEPYLRPIAVRLLGEDDADALALPPFLSDAYAEAEAFCREVGRRPGLSSGFLKTMLLRRIGSTITAGRETALKLLGGAGERVDALTSEEAADPNDAGSEGSGGLYPLTSQEREHLQRLADLLAESLDEDPKAAEVERILLDGLDDTGPWLDLGCIVFSQYLDSARWIAGRLSARIPALPIALYAGGSASGIYRAGEFERLTRETIRSMVASDDLRLVVGTDAASEGLNLQRLGSLVNLDLPWNPTRLEQRKGRIQRIGQVRDEVLIYNMRYRDSVEDRVHDLLSARLRAIRDMFGQLPDTLEDVWVQVALADIERAKQIIDAVPPSHPFEIRYDRIESVDFESCSRVLDQHSQLDALRVGWS
ncbi:MAG TPA: phospholipase D-like domain-containing anti-phage protein [Propionicimonas sp.]|jgi:hypothetical protein